MANDENAVRGLIKTKIDPSAMALTDEAIVGRVREQGETHLFELLMRRNNQRIYRAARAILRDDREAEDVMQDAYVRAYEHLADFDGRARFSTWLTKIAVHEALARLRRAKRHESSTTPISATGAGGESESGSISRAETDVIMSSQPSPERNAANNEMRVLMERAISDLPDDFRQVFVLRAVEEMSGAETAEILGIPEDTVKTRLHRARIRLQTALLSEAETGASDTFTFEAPRCDRVVLEVFRRIALLPGAR